MNKRSLGTRKEDEAARFLTECGLKVTDLNFRSRFGEIDIIARDGEYIVFVEVKYRKTSLAGHPEEAVDVRKATKISKVADYYRLVKKLPYDAKLRFDVVAIEGGQVRWYKNAFTYMN
ncbi:MAG: YraN family protein [Lachnospiraceae bacterium]|nr:YraN family protein [Lachnospiraceae bacterium]